MRKYLLLALLLLTARISFGATYDVPVPTELASHSQWPLKDTQSTLEKDMIAVAYRLPVDLAGKDTPEFEFRGKLGSGFFQVGGDGVYGVCMRSAAKPLVCMLKYPSLAIDEPSRDAALKAKFSGEELLAREKVVRLFSNDPAGILSIEVR